MCRKSFIGLLAALTGFCQAQDVEVRIDNALDRRSSSLDPESAGATPKIIRSMSLPARITEAQSKGIADAYGELVKTILGQITANPKATVIRVPIGLVKVLQEKAWSAQGSVGFSETAVTTDVRAKMSQKRNLAARDSELDLSAEEILAGALEIALTAYAKTGGEPSLAEIVLASSVGSGTYSITALYNKADPKQAGAITTRYGALLDYQLGGNDSRWLPIVAASYTGFGKSRRTTQTLIIVDRQSIPDVELDYSFSGVQTYNGTQSGGGLSFDITAIFSFDKLVVATNYAVPTRWGGDYNYSVTLQRAISSKGQSVFFRYAKDNVLTFGFKSPISFSTK